VLKYFSITPPENSGGTENSTEKSGSHAKNFFCSMYEMNQRHPVWVAENHVKPCYSVERVGNAAPTLCLQTNTLSSARMTKALVSV
jgi:hypothetical protein